MTEMNHSPILTSNLSLAELQAPKTRLRGTIISHADHLLLSLKPNQSLHLTAQQLGTNRNFPEGSSVFTYLPGANNFIYQDDPDATLLQCHPGEKWRVHGLTLNPATPPLTLYSDLEICRLSAVLNKPQIILPENIEQFEGETMSGTYAGLVAVGVGERTRLANQDGIAIVSHFVKGEDKPTLSTDFLVVDGMGGHHDGRMATKGILDRFVERSHMILGSKNRLIDMSHGIVEEFSKLDQLSPSLCSGAAVADVRVQGNQLLANYAGDVHTYVFREGHLLSETEDHKHINRYSVAEISKMGDLFRRQLTAAIYSSLKYEDGKIDEDFIVGSLDREITLEPGDIVIVASDGLTENFTSEEIERIILSTNYSSPYEIRAALHETLLKKSEDPNAVFKIDNISFVVYQHLIDHEQQPEQVSNCI